MTFNHEDLGGDIEAMVVDGGGLPGNGASVAVCSDEAVLVHVALLLQSKATVSVEHLL